MRALHQSLVVILLIMPLSAWLIAGEIPSNADQQLQSSYRLVGMINHSQVGETLQDLAVIRDLASQQTYIVGSGDRLPGMDQFTVHSLNHQGIWLTQNGKQSLTLLAYPGGLIDELIEYPATGDGLDQLSGMSQDYIVDPEEILARTEDYFDHSQTWGVDQGIHGLVTERRAVVTIEEYDVEQKQKRRRGLSRGSKLARDKQKQLWCDEEVCPAEYQPVTDQYADDWYDESDSDGSFPQDAVFD